MTQEIAVMDIGSSKITVMVGDRGVNNTICIHGMGECSYAGFSGGEWYQPEALGKAVSKAISAAQADSGRIIKHLYIGVPGEFTVTKCKEVNIALSRKRKVTEEDLDELHERGNTFDGDLDYTLINSQPVFYMLDDDRKIIQPVGLPTARLRGIVSYILAENTFIETFDRIIEKTEIESYDYVSSLLAETLYLFNDATRDNFVVMVDVGYLVTYIVVARGDGILRQVSIPLGGGHITQDLKEYLGIKFSTAEKLKRKVNLALEADENETYSVSVNDRVTAFSAKQVNEVVTAKLSTLAKAIRKSLIGCDYPDNIPYNLTGGGISYISGARAYLSNKLERDIEAASPSLPQYAHPHLSSLFGLMDMILSQEQPAQKGFFAKIFGR